MHLSLQLNLKETHQLLWLHSRLVCDISPALRQQILQYVRVPTPKTCKKEHFLRDYLWNHSVRAVAQFFILVFTPWSLTWDCLTREGATMNSNVHTFRDAVYAVLRLIGVHFVDRGMLIWDLLGNVFILKHEVRAYEPKSSIFWTITVLMELYKSITISNIPKFYASIWMKVENIQCCSYRWFSDPTKYEKSWLLEPLKFELNELSGCPNRGHDQSYCRMFPWKNPTEVAHILANDYAAIPADLVIPLECWLQRWTGGKRSLQRGALVREFSKNDLLGSYKLKFVKYE